SVLGPRGSIGGNADSRHAAGVNHALHTRLASSIQDVASAFDVGLVELLWVECTQPIVSRNMKERIAPAQRMRQGAHVGEIACNDLHSNRLQITAIGALARQ